MKLAGGDYARHRQGLCNNVENFDGDSEMVIIDDCMCTRVWWCEITLNLQLLVVLVVARVGLGISDVCLLAA